jgi:hypothetical protein
VTSALTVGLHGANDITLQGGNLDEIHSHVTLFKEGWTVRLVFKRELRQAVLVAENLSLEQVIPTIEHLLMTFRDETQLNKAEISHYLDVIAESQVLYSRKKG